MTPTNTTKRYAVHMLGYDHDCLHASGSRPSQFCLICGTCHCGQ